MPRRQGPCRPVSGVARVSGSVRRMSVRPSAPGRVPLTVVVALFLASLALRPQVLAIGPLLPLIREDLRL